MYKVNPDGLGEFDVYCDHKTAGGGWTVFQKRRDGSVNFFRAWDDYKRGFGNLNGEFWLGLDKIHRLTVSSSNKLRVDLEDIHGATAFAEYSSFSVASENAKYQLSLGSYTGDHISVKFDLCRDYNFQNLFPQNYLTRVLARAPGMYWRFRSFLTFEQGINNYQGVRIL